MGDAPEGSVNGGSLPRRFYHNDELALLKALLAQLAARRSCQRHHLESLLAPCSMLAEWLGQGEHSSDALLTCSGF
jgi:hypothetical protein